MRRVGISEPDGMLNGSNRKVRTTSAINSAWTTTLTVSQSPLSLARFLATGALLLSSLARSVMFILNCGARGVDPPRSRADQCADQDIVDLAAIYKRANRLAT